MIGAMVIAGGLLISGFAFGRVRGTWVGASPASAALRRIKMFIVGLIVAFPVMTLMLAKVFQSDVLGWVFGLSLMAGIALLPCAAVFYLGLQVGSRSVRGRKPKSEAVANTIVLIERSGVHASDDAPSRRISVAPDTTLRALVALATADRYVPCISGGKATWVIESSGAGVGAGSNAAGGLTLRPVAVYAEQWAEVKFLVGPEVSIAVHFGATLPMLSFSYRSQEDPDTVLARLRFPA